MLNIHSSKWATYKQFVIIFTPRQWLLNRLHKLHHCSSLSPFLTLKSTVALNWLPYFKGVMRLNITQAEIAAVSGHHVGRTSKSSCQNSCLVQLGVAYFILWLYMMLFTQFVYFVFCGIWPLVKHLRTQSSNSQITHTVFYLLSLTPYQCRIHVTATLRHRGKTHTHGINEFLTAILWNRNRSERWCTHIYSLWCGDYVW